jgi:hypothetical protein
MVGLLWMFVQLFVWMIRLVIWGTWWLLVVPTRAIFRSAGRQRKSRYWTHPGCSIHHRTQDAANRCRVGRR